ncbi:MAG: tryptophan synthase subunit alpha [Planctomycetales bacterium]
MPSIASRISATFAALHSRRHMAFMPFVTAGDPDMEATLAVVRELAAAGVDLIEIGFPYSDPIADGPVIQASYTRALAKGLHVRDIFAGIASLPSDELPPLVAMVSFAIVFRMGAEQFLSAARDAGFAGLIVPDLPGDEAAELAEAARIQGLDLIELIAPTTPPERARRILATASGFVYCISVAGTTGVRNELPPELVDQLRELRARTDLPLAVGFGISRPEQVDALRGHAEGIIVGSAIVRRMGPMGEGGPAQAEALAEIGRFAAEMVAAAHHPRE